MAYSNQLRKKIEKQLDLIGNRIAQLRQKVPVFIQFLQQQIPLYAAKIRAPEKEIRVDYSNIPKLIAASIISSGLDRKMWWLGTVKFELDSGFCNELEGFEDRLYDILNYIVYTVKLAHPSESVGDRFESLVKNTASLEPRIGAAVVAAEKWVTEFKEQRRITAHRSPKTCYLEFALVAGDREASFVVVNNENASREDLFRTLGWLDELERLYSGVRQAIESMLKR